LADGAEPADNSRGSGGVADRSAVDGVVEVGAVAAVAAARGGDVSPLPDDHHHVMPAPATMPTAAAARQSFALPKMLMCSPPEDLKVDLKVVRLDASRPLRATANTHRQNSSKGA
jgi:hypothetical protein